MKDGNAYTHRALTGGIASGLGAVVLLPAAVIVGQLLVVVLMHVFGADQVDGVKSFFTLLAVSFAFGLMSGVGAILFVVELWYLVKFLHEDVSAIDFFPAGRGMPGGTL